MSATMTASARAACRLQVADNTRVSVVASRAAAAIGPARLASPMLGNRLSAASASICSSARSARPVAVQAAVEGIKGDYAVVDIGGSQKMVAEGRFYTCNNLNVEPGSKIEFGRVLAVKSGDKFEVGRPYLEGASVQATVLEELRGPKVIVYKMKPKKHTRKKQGHRQELTKFLVTKVSK